MPSTTGNGGKRRVTISKMTDSVTIIPLDGDCDETGADQPPISPPHDHSTPHNSANNNLNSLLLSSQCSTNGSTVDVSIIRKRELLRLESLVRCQVQSQWQLSIENYSKLRKRQSSQLSPSLDTEMGSYGGTADCSANSLSPSSPTGQITSPSDLQTSSKEFQVSEDEYHESDFGHKPSLWRKTIRSVILRLRGQEQHKDVYVMPQHLRAQLKQMYVY